jgi:hypothetical protein
MGSVIMSMSGAISLACLVITGGLAALGVFSRHFDDSLAQRVGLSLLAIACILRIPDKLADLPTAPEVLMAQIGLAVFGIGTVFKLRRVARKRQRMRPLCEVRVGDAHQVGGGRRRDDVGLH